MDLDDTIRPWLLACGSHWGANQAYKYRRSDTSTRADVPYFTYRPINGFATEDGRTTTSAVPSAESNDVTSAAEQKWIVTVGVDLYNHEDGFEGLMWCGVAAMHDTAIKALLKSNMATFRRVVSVEDNTDYDADDIYYHHYMTVEFHTVASYKHVKINDRIRSVNIDDAFKLELPS